MIDFPASPTIGQRYQNEPRGMVYYWDGEKWLFDPARMLYVEITGLPDIGIRGQADVQLEATYHNADGTTTVKDPTDVIWSSGSHMTVDSAGMASFSDTYGYSGANGYVAVSDAVYASPDQNRSGTWSAGRVYEGLIVTIDDPYTWFGGPTRQMNAYRPEVDGTLTDVTEDCTWSPTTAFGYPTVSNTAGTKGLLSPPTVATVADRITVQCDYTVNDPYDNIGSSHLYRVFTTVWEFPNAP